MTDLPTFESVMGSDHQMTELVWDYGIVFPRKVLYLDGDGDLWMKIGDGPGTYLDRNTLDAIREANRDADD